MEKKASKVSTKQIVYIGMFAALLAVLSQISIPMPSGVPITLQTFAVAFTGVVLSWKLGGASTIVYVLIGAVGVPVFANFSGGFQVLMNYTGGFIWGFIFLAVLCGVATLLKNKVLALLVSLLGLCICHLLGILQFSVVMGMNFKQSALLVSVPYLIKDVISVVLAYSVGIQVRKRLFSASLLNKEV